MGYKQIYVLKRSIDDPAKVYHEDAFGGMGFGNIEDWGFSKQFNIIGMDKDTVTVQKRNETV